MLSINPNITTGSVAFAQNNKKNSQQYPKTHAGLGTSLGMSGLGCLSIHFSDKLRTNNISPKVAAEMLPLKAYFPIFVAANIACGLFIDKLINNKNKKFAQSTQGMQPYEAATSQSRARLNSKGNAYYSSNTGKKIGSLLGLGVLPALALIRGKGKLSPLLAINAVIGGLGGLCLGSITDYFANKNAKKYANKLVAEKNVNK